MPVGERCWKRRKAEIGASAGSRIQDAMRCDAAELEFTYFIQLKNRGKRRRAARVEV